MEGNGIRYFDMPSSKNVMDDSHGMIFFNITLLLQRNRATDSVIILLGESL